MKNYKYILLLTGILLLSASLIAQEIENDLESRYSLKLSHKVNDNLKLSVVPELRLNQDFSVDDMLIEGGATFKPIKLLSLNTKYRIIANYRDGKDTEYLGRFAVSATIKDKFNRIKPSFRIRYSNYADDEINDKEYLRYKASLEYDIADSGITPFVGAELYQQLDENELYKMRYSLGLDYKLFKKNYISLAYKLDYYLQDYRNKHIIDLSYKIKL